MWPGHFLRAVLAGLLLSGALLTAQEPVAPTPTENQELPLPSPGEPYKLHVYAKLLQIPTIIQDDKQQVPTDLVRESVRITLDGGPEFLPTFLRLQGEDPVSLAVLIDDTGNQQKTVDTVIQELPKLVPVPLRSERDTLALSVVDCAAYHTVSASMANAEAISGRLQKLLAAPGLHGKKAKGACSGSLKLWDAAAAAVRELSATSGRRVLLIVSQGDDEDSKISPAELSDYAVRQGVAVFALRDEVQHQSELAVSRMDMEWRSRAALGNPRDPLDALVVRNGGLMYASNVTDIGNILEDFFATLRNRYIIEFTAPSQAERGNHIIAVTVPGLTGLVRTAGDSSPLPDPAVENDPTTIKTKPSQAVFGTKKPKD